MCGSETFATEVSSTSMNVASMTDPAITHGFAAGRHDSASGAALVAIPADRSSSVPLRGLAGADEGAHELAVHRGGDRRDVDAFAVAQERARVLGTIDPRRLEVDRLEPGLGELRAVVVVVERARHAADPELDAAADRRGHLAAHNDVGDREAAARLQHAEGLGEHAVLVGGEIDDAVRDDHVD